MHSGLSLPSWQYIWIIDILDSLSIAKKTEVHRHYETSRETTYNRRIQGTMEDSHVYASYCTNSFSTYSKYHSNILIFYFVLLLTNRSVTMFHGKIVSLKICKLFCLCGSVQQLAFLLTDEKLQGKLRRKKIQCTLSTQGLKFEVW